MAGRVALLKGKGSPDWRDNSVGDDKGIKLAYYYVCPSITQLELYTGVHGCVQYILIFISPSRLPTYIGGSAIVQPSQKGLIRWNPVRMVSDKENLKAVQSWTAGSH